VSHLRFTESHQLARQVDHPPSLRVEEEVPDTPNLFRAHNARGRPPGALSAMASAPSAKVACATALSSRSSGSTLPNRSRRPRRSRDGTERIAGAARLFIGVSTRNRPVPSHLYTAS